MRRYTITVNGTDHVIDVEEVTADNFTVLYEGRRVDVRVSAHADLAQAAITPHVEVRGSHAPSIFGTDAGPAPAAATAAGPSPSQPARPAGRTPRPSVEADPNALTAPMPGVVLEVLKQPGDQVARGDVILVLEAMKMKNSLRASRDAVIASVQVKPGDPVVHGQKLVSYEA